jgi:AcrR family transcriptional regulator
VSRTALYRHFADKSALLAAVAREGFRTLRLALADAWERGGRGPEAFDAMSVVYVRFAVDHPSHYRVMFGGFVDARRAEPDLQEESAGAFQVLVDALIAQQREGLVRGDEPSRLPKVRAKRSTRRRFLTRSSPRVAEFFFRNLGVFGALGV